MNVAFETSLKEIAGLNWELVRLLEQELHIATVEEALLYLPFRYVDRRFFVPVDDVRGPDGMVQVVGVVSQMEVVGQGRKQRLVAKLQGSRRSFVASDSITVGFASVVVTWRLERWTVSDRH